MSEHIIKLEGPDLTQGVQISRVPEGGMLLGHAHGEPVLLVRQGESCFAIGAVCSHYSGSLADGLVVGESIRCPLHHACFSLRSGEALRAPALSPVSCWRVERSGTAAQGQLLYVRERLTAPADPRDHTAVAAPASVIIIGGGPAGNAAAETLRHEGYSGAVTMFSADEALPCDRPNLSKSYLAGTAPEEWLALRPAQFYREQQIDLRLGTAVSAIDVAHRQVRLADGSTQEYGALLLATGATPVPLEVPGSKLPHVHYLRTLADSRALIADALAARSAVVIGASFIGLEVAASLRARNLDVHVVAPEAVPMERILGAQAGNFIRELHQQHGVSFHLGTAVTGIDAQRVALKDGSTIAADLVVVGIGVRPALSLAEQAGLTIDRGVVVDQYLRTSAAQVFAAGDIARWPDRRSGESIRIEHFVVAERQGQTVGRNMLGRREVFDAVPFFWSEHYDVSISYVGHAERWDACEIDGSLQARDCTLTYRRAGRTLAVAVMGRDLAGLRAELEFERSTAAE
jgi:NADPH-dependent 2,4-dienoyl-CoA reductase/sulfur reductase-like enzyme/nitrite reductase/ring-hydroxylating ferredoxin subunit